MNEGLHFQTTMLLSGSIVMYPWSFYTRGVFDEMKARYVALLLAIIFLTPVMRAQSRPAPQSGSTKTGVPASVGASVPGNSREAGSSSGGDSGGDKQKNTSVSTIQVMFPPGDIFTSGDTNSSSTLFGIRESANHKPVLLVSGELEDKDSHRRLPATAFKIAFPGDCNKEYFPESTGSGDQATADKIVPLRLCLKKDWIHAGNYSGVLRIAAQNDSAAQDLKLNVSIRPWCSWWLGLLFIVLGAGISWFAITYAVRQRQMAGNEILVARLAALMQNLKQELGSMPNAKAPAATQTLRHIETVLKDRLPQLRTDREISVIAGVSVPSSGTITVLDEIEGINRVVRNGFESLLNLWKNGGDRTRLEPCFASMDQLGGEARPLSEIDLQIKNILLQAASRTSPALENTLIRELSIRELPKEEAVVHRVIFTTYLLDLVSFSVVVLLGVYILIWKNPGFGSIGNFLEAFFWGLGLKLGTDASRLGQSDVRTAFGIKIPAP